mmetsp:Transcript_60063/g.147674  ORF Transcript_60063/g.147674 Transcript_60063/m.147674 type:complete len:193 (+) Transcript_60063:449-1027(+)
MIFFSKFWDEEKKIIIVLKKSNLLFLNQKLFPSKSNFYIEEIMSIDVCDRVENFFLISEKNHFLKWLKYIYISKFNWFYFLVFSYITKSGFFVQRFRLFEKNLIKPDFFCSKKKKIKETTFSILFFKKGFWGFHPSLLTLLLIRLKPGFLKIAIIGKSNFMFFSIDVGFSFTNPVFLRMKSKKKRKKFNFFY